MMERIGRSFDVESEGNKDRAAVEAERVASTAAAIAARDRAGLDVFVEQLRDWVIHHFELPGSRAEQVEKTHLLLRVMMSATTIDEVVGFRARFQRLVWGDRSFRVEADADGAWLVFDQPSKPGIAGLLGDLWSLSFLLTELEFLAGGRIEQVRGRVRAEGDSRFLLAPLLFNRPLAYGARDLALHLPASALARPTIARPDQVAQFLGQLMPRTVSGSAPRPEMARIVAAMIRADRVQGADPALTVDTLSAQLGLSAATLRRRLAAEGTSYRAMRENVLEDLATTWLQEGMKVDAVADRLGYSDAFAFRRAFRRTHGCSPSDFRRTARSQKTMDAENTH